ncbi:DUF2452 domain-containing protein [uncultured Winogradskyella sp.]|uniref:DUF2452 domain-containing protein n=1 Tax=uncultured Winogradskyella sp. TaxID=395353 RepID=UPI0026291E16|nr:DUF2452 domain-containing protein [uncultured Winogradskyella sp.]
MKEKKPDMVVYDEEKEQYNAAFLPYATSFSAPQIKAPNNGSWKNSQIYKANKHLKTKYEALKAEYEALMKILEYNELITASKFSFEPLIGEIYHLYNNAKDQPFLSIINPDTCDFEHLGSFRLTSDYLWEKVDSKTQSIALNH